MSGGSRLLAAVAARDSAQIQASLADDVAFHSPVADYTGRDDVAHLMTTVAGLLDGVRVERELATGSETVSFISARVAGHGLQGVIDEIRAPDGRVAEVTLMLRPLEALLAAVQEMGAALAASPLPSGRPLAPSLDPGAR